MAVLLGVVGGLLLAIIVVILLRPIGGSDEALETTTLPTSTTEAVTSTTEETTTTSSTTTTTSTTSTTLAPLVLEPDGIGGVAFGATPDDAITYATAVLGPADRDTGWVDSSSEFGTCPPPEVRGVQWGESLSGFGHAFTLLFTQAPTSHKPEGGEHLFGYDCYGGDLVLTRRRA